MNTNSKNLVILFALALFGIGFTTSCETNNGTADAEQVETQDTLVQEEVVEVDGADDVEMDTDTAGMTAEEKQLYQELSTLEDSLENTIQRMENKMETAADEVGEETNKEYTEALVTLKEKKAEVEHQIEKLEEDAEKDWEEFKKETEQMANDIKQWMEKNL